MNIEERILKLAAIGWNGKDDIMEFFKEQYGITTGSLSFNTELQELVIMYKVGTQNVCTSFRSPTDLSKEKIIDCVLRLFKTTNGKVVGPDNGIIHEENVEWT